MIEKSHVLDETSIHFIIDRNVLLTIIIMVCCWLSKWILLVSEDLSS